MRYVILLVGLLALAAGAQAQQTFHLHPDMGIGLEPAGDFEVPVSAEPVRAGPASAGGGPATAFWERTMEEAGTAYLSTAEFTLHVKQPTIGLTVGGDGCALTAAFGILGESWVYWCLLGLADAPILPGEYRFRFSTANPAIAPIAYQAGDVLWFEVYSVSTQGVMGSMFVTPGEAGAFLVLDGTKEPVREPAPEPTPEPTPEATREPEPEPTPEPTPEGTPEPEPSPEATQGPPEASPPAPEPVQAAPPSEAAAPAPALLAALVAALWLVRRR